MITALKKECVINYERKTERNTINAGRRHEKMRKKREKLENPLPKETLTPEEWKEKKREEREGQKALAR
jgi:hypothetical protein